MNTEQRQLTVVERITIRDLMATEDGLSAYTFWRRYRMGPGALISGLQRLVKEGLVAVDGANIQITQKGRNVVRENRWEFFAVRERPWRECPQEFVQPSLKINRPYIPQWTQVATEILPESYQLIKRSLRRQK
jgi:hypothetical protein